MPRFFPCPVVAPPLAGLIFSAALPPRFRIGLRALLLIAGLALPSSALAQWSQLNGAEPAVVAALGTDGTTMYLGTNEADAGELFRSTDQGESWANAGLPNGGIGEILFDNGNWYLGTYLDGIHRSTDGGFEWTRVIPNLTVESIVRQGPNLISGEGFFFPAPIHWSTDDGVTWGPVPGAPSVLFLSAVSDGANVYVGTDGDGIYRSTDDGATWESLAGAPASCDVYSMCVLDGDIYASVRRNSPVLFGIYRSTDGGETWNPTPGSPVSDTGAEIHCLAADDGNLYAGAAGLHGEGIYRSTDLGTTWESIDASLPGSRKALEFLVDVGPDASFLVGTEEGLYRTDDDGQTWAESGQGTGAIRGAAALADHDGTLYVGLTTNGTQGRGVWRSANNGESWSRSPGLPATTHARAFLSRSSELLAGVYSPFPRGVYRSSDGGETWAPSSNGISTSTILHELVDDGGTLWAAAWEALYRSTDDGANWDAVGGLTEVNSVIRFGNRVFAGMTDLRVRVTTDGGETWVPFNAGLPANAPVQQFGIVDGTLLLALWQGGIYRLEDDVWTPTSIDSGFHRILQPIDGALITQDILSKEISYSTDLGTTWTSFDEGFFGGEIYSMTVSSGQLVAGTRGYGVWSRPLSDLPGTATLPGTDVRGPELEFAVRPNPVSDEATFSFRLREAGDVRLALFDAEGRELAQILRGSVGAGIHEITVGRDRFSPIASTQAVIFARLTTDTGIATRKVIRVR